MSKHKDKIPGGKADGKSAKDFDPKCLADGIKHEMEHTTDKGIAQEIAMDHLTEDKNYYKKLKDIEKYDRVEVEADGKKEFDYGSEDLDKLKKKWSSLKKAVVDSDASIMEIAGQEYNPDEEDDDEQEIDQLDDEGAGSESDDQSSDEGSDGGAESELEDGEDVPADDGSDTIGEVGDEGQDQQEVIETLQEAGYSEAEIAHIVHDHSLPTPNIDDIKMDGESAKIQQTNDHGSRMDDLEFESAKKEQENGHQDRMNDLEYETAQQEQGTNSLDRDHKQRMLDLEFDSAQKEKEMELDFKQKELEMKLKHKEESQREATATKKANAQSRSQDASKTSKKERAGK